MSLGFDSLPCFFEKCYGRHKIGLRECLSRLMGIHTNEINCITRCLNWSDGHGGS